MKFGEKGILSIGNGPGIDYSILLFGLKEYTSGIVIQCLVGLKNKNGISIQKIKISLH